MHFLFQRVIVISTWYQTNGEVWNSYYPYYCTEIYHYWSKSSSIIFLIKLFWWSIINVMEAVIFEWLDRKRWGRGVDYPVDLSSNQRQFNPGDASMSCFYLCLFERVVFFFIRIKGRMKCERSSRDFRTGRRIAHVASCYQSVKL